MDKVKALLVITAFVIGFILGFGIERRNTNELKEEYANELLKAEQQARQEEQRLQAEKNALTAQFEKDKKNAQDEIDALRRRISDGSVRLSVPVKSCDLSESTGAGVEQARAELDPKTADDLVRIATDGDNAIRELNLCIDSYNLLRSKK